MSLLNLKLHFAVFFNENGEYITTKHISKTDKKFKYKNKKYNINRKEASYFERKGLIYDKRYYFYNISSSDPYKLTKPEDVLIDPEMYNDILETKVTKDLNTVKESLLEKIDVKTAIFILLGVGALIYFLVNGGVK